MNLMKIITLKNEIGFDNIKYTILYLQVENRKAQPWIGRKHQLNLIKKKNLETVSKL